MSTLAENKAVVTRFIQALGSGDADTIASLMHDDIAAVCTGTSLLSGTRGHADICTAVGMLGQMTQGGIAFTILSLTAEDERVSCEVEGRSTLVNGTPYDNQYHFLFSLRDGKVVRLKEYMDTKLVDDALGPLLRAAAG